MDLAEAKIRKANGEIINFCPIRGFHEAFPNSYKVSEIVCFDGRCFINQDALNKYLKEKK